MSADLIKGTTENAKPQVLSPGRPQKADTQSSVDQKIHELSQKKPVSLEGQCISRILENTIHQIEIAATLPAFHYLVGVADSDVKLRGALQVHHVLGERLKTPDQDSNGAREEVGGAKKASRSQLERAFKNSVKDLLRLFRFNQDVRFSLRTEFGMRLEEIEYTLIRGLEKFHWHMIGKLDTSPDEKLQLVFFKKSSCCPLEVAATIKQRDADIARKNYEITLLESSLRENNTTEDDWMVRADKQCQSLIKTSKVKQGAVQKDIFTLNIKLNNLMIENRENERVLLEENERIELEIENLLHDFDDEIELVQPDLEKNETENERLEVELKELEKPYADLEERCNYIWEKRRLAEEMKKQMEEQKLKETVTPAPSEDLTTEAKKEKGTKKKGKGKKGKGKKKGK